MKVSDLRGILQYIPRFRERVFVVAIDGDVIVSENFSNVLLDLAVLRSLNIRIILVHGAALQIERAGQERGVAISNSDGTGVTDGPTLDLSLDVIARATNEVMQGLTSVDLRAAYSNAIIAHPFGIRGGVDYLHTGKVERVDAAAIRLFLNEGMIPVIPPLGFDGEGKTFRVNSDAIAVEVAEAVRAAKIIYLMPDDGLCDEGKVVRQLSVAEAQEVLKRRKLGSNLASKIEQGARACQSSVPRVHLLNGMVNEALLTEIFSHDGIGTMIYSNDYQQIRRVFKKDVRAVMGLISQSVSNEELIRRTKADILARLEDYWVLEIDRVLVGCVAVHCYPEEKMAEMACLYVARDAEGQGYGRRLMAFAEKRAGEQGMKQMVALSTQTFAYFQQKGGYREADVESLPPERRERYRASNRNSKILVKDIVRGGGPIAP